MDSNPSPYSNSEDEDIEGDNVDSPFNGDHSGQCSSDYSDDGGDLSDGSGEHSDSDLSEDSNESDDSSGDWMMTLILIPLWTLTVPAMLPHLRIIHQTLVLLGTSQK